MRRIVNVLLAVCALVVGVAIGHISHGLAPVQMAPWAIFGILSTGEGTLSDLIATKNLSVAKFGEDNILQILANDAKTWNTLAMTFMSDLCEISQDQQRIYGASTNNQLKEISEHGRPETQRPRQGSQVAFPLRRYGTSLGWTRAWMKNKTPSDLAIMVDQIQKAHKRKIYGVIAQAIFGASNYTFQDYMRNGVNFTIKRFLNADGFAIPDGPNGEVFNPATHTHYTAIAGGIPTGAAVTALVQNVLEHRVSQSFKVAFNQLDETNVRAMTGFVPYPDPRIVWSLSQGAIGDKKLDITRQNNRAIGILNSAEVWIKPWVPQFYAFAWDDDPALGEKPLVMRVDLGEAGPDLQMIPVDSAYPLHIEGYETAFGVAAYTRTGGAALYFNGSTWTDATITGF